MKKSKNDFLKDLIKPEFLNDFIELKRKLISKQDFPIDVFPEGIQLIVNELNGTLSYNIDYLACGFMSVISTINGNKFKLQVKRGWNAPSIFWFIILGNSGAMKTHPVKWMLKPLEKLSM
jgi:hypothetical protein